MAEKREQPKPLPPDPELEPQLEAWYWALTPEGRPALTPELDEYRRGRERWSHLQNRLWNYEVKEPPKGPMPPELEEFADIKLEWAARQLGIDLRPYPSATDDE